MTAIFKKLTSFLLLLSLIVTSLAACSDGTPTAASNNASEQNPAGAPTADVAGTVGTGTGPNAGAVSQTGGQPLPTPTPPGPDSRRVITVWTGGWKGNPDYEKFINDVIDQYRIRNPRITIDWRDWGANLATEFEKVATNPEQAPDIILLNAADFLQEAAQKYLVDITELAGSNIKDEYVPAVFDGLRSGSIYYGLPWVVSTRVTIINKKLWQQATLDPVKPPKTYTELEQMLPLMASKTAETVRPVWAKPDPLTDFMMDDAKIVGVRGDGKGTQPDFPSAQTTASWEYYADKRRRDIFDRDGLTKGYADALKKYAAGQLVMVLDGAPLLPGLKNASAEVYSNTLVVPHVVGKAEALPADLQGWAIPKSSRQHGEALLFLRFLNSGENQLAFAKLSGLTVPSVKKALTDPFITGQSEPLAQARAIMATSLDRTRSPEQLMPVPLKPGDRAKLLDALNKGIATVWTREKTPQAALTEAAKVWTEVLK